MASVSILLRTCSIICWLILSVHGNSDSASEPWINTIEVSSKHCVENKCKYFLNVRGGEFLGHYSWRLTPAEGLRGSNCDVIYPNYDLREADTGPWLTRIFVSVPYADGKIFFCLHHGAQKNSPFGGRFVHQGTHLFLDPTNDLNGIIVGKSQAQNEIPSTNEHLTLSENANSTIDLSHDIDVNYQKPSSLTLSESKYVEVLQTSGSQPLYRAKTAQNPGRKAKREIVKMQPNNVTESELDFVSMLRDDQYPASSEIRVEGLRVEESEKNPTIVDNVPNILAGTTMTLRLFGDGLSNRTVIAFTTDPMAYGEPCKFLIKGEYTPRPNEVYAKSAVFDCRAPELSHPHLYICAKNLKLGIKSAAHDNEVFLHQGTDPWCIFASHEKILPLWANLTIIFLCLIFSALFSGLNLGLMSLDRTELKIIANTGTDEEKKCARAIMPVRDHGNYLLCSILLGNVAVNSTFTILIDDLTSGLFAVIFSTLAIVLLGEITPQAICSRHGLAVGARTICITKAVMCITAPLAYPISKILDYLLGEEIGSVYNRERLKELVKVTTDLNDLDRDEVNIISGALELRKKTVSDIMTKIQDVFMLPIDSVLDFETMSEIVKSGYSRIPVYEGSRTNIVTVLFIKDLAFVDPDDNTPLRTLCQYYQNSCNFVFEDVTLDVMFKQFKDGHKGHMAFVHSINDEGEGDPFYETIGLVTLEDVIEEMIQAEIVDETDVFMDNRTKRLRKRPTSKLADFTAFAERSEHQRVHVSPQMTLATFQFLSSSVSEFRPNVVSETVLRRLLQQDVFRHIKIKGKEKTDPSLYLYQQGKSADYMSLVLEGRVEVQVGREGLLFESGPFAHFGAQALEVQPGVDLSSSPPGSQQNIHTDLNIKRVTFVPDYSVRAVTDVTYLVVKRSLYLAAKRATLMEKGIISRGQANDQIDSEVDKMFNSVTEDLSVSGDNRTPSRQVSPNLPSSASPHTRATFSTPLTPRPLAPLTPPTPPTAPQNGDLYRANAEPDEHDKLLQ